ncbi:MAG: hypothetical protein JSV56_00360 [Methanomassiliicoccales archaeon]|nr:MAG: hypothetical protein JSV56_00360 [Methanomassiliicoccales archaeon]
MTLRIGREDGLYTICDKNKALILKENEELLSESYGEVNFYYFRGFSEPCEDHLYLTNKRLVFVGNVRIPIDNNYITTLFISSAEVYYRTRKKLIRFAEIYHSEPFQVRKTKEGYYLYFKRKLYIIRVKPKNKGFKGVLENMYKNITVYGL